MSKNIFLNHAHIYPAEAKEYATLEKLKETMDYCSIDKAVAFAPLSPEYVQIDGSDRTANEWLYQTIKNEKNIVGFGAVDFKKGNLKQQVEEIYQYGFKGIKLHPAFQEFNIICSEACEVYEKAEELGLFISFHTGIHWYRLSHYNVLLFDEVAWHYPKLRFSMEHVGGYSFFNDALAVMCNNSKKGDYVFAGLTSVDNSNGNGAWSLSDEQIKDLIFQTGERRTIVGMDFPHNSNDAILNAINRIKNLDIPQETKDALLGENLERALYPENYINNY